MDERVSGGGLRLVPIVLAVVAIGFMVVKGCQTGPFGRRQVVALNAQQEAALGAQAYQEVLQKSDVVRSGPVVDDVDEVARRLIRASTDPGYLAATGQQAQKFDWQVRVVRSKEVNAFCLPGGKIVVYTGILPVARTNAGLAAVMGHEIAHALAHHGAERMAQQQIANIGVVAAGASLGEMRDADRAKVMMALGFATQAGILKYSRKHESEADHMGLLMMAAAGYNPEEAPKFWERMRERAGGSRTPEFLSTHPSHGTRVDDLNRWMPEALKLYQAAPTRVKTEPLRLSGLR